jgi:hypothetical protein
MSSSTDDSLISQTEDLETISTKKTWVPELVPVRRDDETMPPDHASAGIAAVVAGEEERDEGGERDSRVVFGMKSTEGEAQKRSGDSMELENGQEAEYGADEAFDFSSREDTLGSLPSSPLRCTLMDAHSQSILQMNSSSRQSRRSQIRPILSLLFAFFFRLSCSSQLTHPLPQLPFPIETFSHIFYYLDRPSDFASLCLTCHALLPLVHPLLYRSLRITLQRSRDNAIYLPPRFKLLALSLTKNRTLAQTVQELSIHVQVWSIDVEAWAREMRERIPPKERKGWREEWDCEDLDDFDEDARDAFLDPKRDATAEEYLLASEDMEQHRLTDPIHLFSLFSSLSQLYHLELPRPPTYDFFFTSSHIPPTLRHLTLNVLFPLDRFTSPFLTSRTVNTVYGMELFGILRLFPSLIQLKIRSIANARSPATQNTLDSLAETLKDTLTSFTIPLYPTFPFSSLLRLEHLSVLPVGSSPSTQINANTLPSSLISLTFSRGTRRYNFKAASEDALFEAGSESSSTASSPTASPLPAPPLTPTFLDVLCEHLGDSSYLPRLSKIAVDLEWWGRNEHGIVASKRRRS